jgi:hypothetical protein
MMKRLVLAVTVVVVGLLASASFSQAGRIPDPGIAVKAAEAYQTVVFHDYFYRFQVAKVEVVGSGNGRLILSVYDQDGDLVASDAGEDCSVSWTPTLFQQYTIEVRNPNGYIVGFVIRTN